MKSSRITSGLIVLSVAGIAFVLSFKNIQGLAADNGYTSLSFLVPFVIDLPIIAFSISAMVNTIQGSNNRKDIWLIGLFTFVSVVFNIAHSNMELIGISIAVLIPSALFLSFHSFMSQVEHSVKESQIIDTIQGLIKQKSDLENEVDSLEKLNDELDKKIKLSKQHQEKIERAAKQYEVDFKEATKQKALDAEKELIAKINKLKVEYETIKQEKQNAELSESEMMMVGYLRINEGAKYDDIAAFIGKSKGTVSNYATKLIGNGILIKNGVGLKVME